MSQAFRVMNMADVLMFCFMHFASFKLLGDQGSRTATS